jgi:hypothetical protein
MVVSLENFHQGRKLWKWAESKVYFFVVKLPTKSPCVLIFLRLSTGNVENPSITRF